MHLKVKTMQYLAALSLMILSICAQTPQHHHNNQLQQQSSNHMNLQQIDNHRYHQSQHHHKQHQYQQLNQQPNYQPPNLQQTNRQQHQYQHPNQQPNYQLNLQQTNRQQHQHHHHQSQQYLQQQKDFHVKAQLTLDGYKKQKYQQEKFNQNVQKQLQNHQLDDKQGKNADLLASLQKEAKAPLGRQKQPLPLVLSPEKIHAMDLDPAITVVEPPKNLAEPEHKKTSEVKKRQFSYDAAIASLYQEALKVADNEHQTLPLNSITASIGQFSPLPAAVQPIFKFKPVVAPTLEEQLLQNPRPFHLPQTSNDLKSQLPQVSYHQQVEEKQEEEEEEEEEDEYKSYAAKYQYGYRVVDDHENSDFGQTESRDGDMTRGHYHVRLPDGRMQRVKYWSDPSGFHAQISYDRDAVHI